jgi:hypothetical protein
MQNSRHLVKESLIYEFSFKKGFERFFGPIDSYVFFGLLPSYLERQNSSLIYMVSSFIKQTEDKGSGFFLYDFKNLYEQIRQAHISGKRIVLWGVSFALLDYIQEYTMHIPEMIVIETGGMKGRKKEMIREEMHDKLKKGFGTKNICSEYGMTEMLSQAYSMGDGKFRTVPWLKVRVREINDPFKKESEGKTGGINIIDLANIYSCSFIATQDLGRVNADGTFEVLGRFDNSDIRGCSLLI